MLEEAYGYQKRILRVNLTTGVIRKETLDLDIAAKFLGGSGFGSWVLIQEVPTGVNWDSAENRLIFAAGPLNGSIIPGTGSFFVKLY